MLLALRSLYEAAAEVVRPAAGRVIHALGIPVKPVPVEVFITGAEIHFSQGRIFPLSGVNIELKGTGFQFLQSPPIPTGKARVDLIGTEMKLWAGSVKTVTNDDEEAFLILNSI